MPVLKQHQKHGWMVSTFPREFVSTPAGDALLKLSRAELETVLDAIETYGIRCARQREDEIRRTL